MVAGSAEEGSPAWLFTIRGSTHLAWTDFAVLYSNAMSLAFKAMVDPERVLRLTLTTTLEFLGRVLPRERQGFAQLDDGILERAASVALEDISREHRPADKWIAARLKIEHELSLRTSAWFRRQLARARRRSRQNGLAQLDEGSIEDEIWMHLQPHSSWGQGTR